MRVKYLLMGAFLGVTVGSAHADDLQVCWGTNMDAPQKVSVQIRCVKQAGVTDAQISDYKKALRADDADELNDCLDQKGGEIPFDWLEDPKTAADGAQYSIYGSWGFDEKEPMLSTQWNALLDTSLTVTLGTCHTTMLPSQWANTFLPAHDNEVLVCDDGQIRSVAGLSCASFDY